MTTYPRDINVSQLDTKVAFSGLSPKEQLYACHIGKASWEGAKICLFQCSYEAPVIFSIFQLVFGGEDASDDASFARLKTASGLSDESWADFVIYAAAFYANMGNYKSFGDCKILPALPAEEFHKVLTSSKSYKTHKALLDELWEAVRELLYSTDVKELGFPPSGSTSYYSANASKADAERAQAYLDAKQISGYNTRVFKQEEDGETTYIVRLSAAEAKSEEEVPAEEYEGVNIKVVPGDFAPFMARVVSELEKAQAHVANVDQEKMLKEYVRSFSTGSVDAHVEASKHWVKDKGPSVESYIGHIESYRDPFGTTGEWEGFVAVVNRAMSEKFTLLVETAESLLPLLPWGADFEKDRFLRPDFTSLDVLAFASSGIPAGINIPNYDTIRQDFGFKNVSLGNVLAASLSAKTVNFLQSGNGDEPLFKDLVKEAFEVQVGIHELLGHGSGKLLYENNDGTFNFDREKTLNPLTGEPVTSFYKPGETWDSKFPVFGSSYEECRAELVGIYLCVNEKVLSIFGHEGEKAQDILYVNWLNMARAGLMALEFFRPQTGTWGQAHMQARFCILRVMLEAGQDFVTITPDEEKGVIITLDRSKIMTVGLPAVEIFLKKIQVYKSTADYAAAKAMYVDGYSVVPADLLALRDVVLAKKKERPLFVQPNLVLKGEEVSLMEYPATVEGVVQSFQERFPALDEDLLALWRKDKEAMLPLYLRAGATDGGGAHKRRKSADMEDEKVQVDGGNGNAGAH